MEKIKLAYRVLGASLFSLLLSSCATYSPYATSTSDENLRYPGISHWQYKPTASQHNEESNYPARNYASRLPQHLSNGEKTILIDPNVHAWGAYDAQGDLVHSGLVTAGSNWCPDIGRPCRTRAGSFRVQSLGSPGCKSTIYPLHKGGAPMPYCMFFNGNQGLHGSAAVVEGNISHGCVRMHVADAEWLRYNFAHIGTKVVVKSY